MRSLLSLILYCISLVSLQQLLTLALEESPEGNRLDLLTKIFDHEEDKALDSGSHRETALPSPSCRQLLKRLTVYLRRQQALRVRRSLPSLSWARPTQTSPIDQKAPKASRPARGTSPSLAWARPSVASQIEQRPLRVRRNLRVGHHHSPQLMRVGCVLGTCQVQNLSHRLYQLIGQSGKEDSSPINPRSPHSYG